MNFKLVNKVVYRICEPTPQTAAKILGVSVSDLFSEGNLGLWKAYKTFKPEKSKWSTYAATCISNEVFGFMRKANIYKKNCQVSLELETFADDSNYEDFIESDETRLITQELLNKLQGMNKQIFEIRLNHPSINQKGIGVIIGLSRSYVAKRDVEIKTELKKICQELGGCSIGDIIHAPVVDDVMDRADIRILK